jgi:phosphoribosylaminoimidazole-succinocarboxamide synthase
VELELIASGKVREVYALREDPTKLLMVATDRISAFDCIMDRLVRDKGRLLSAISATAFRSIDDSYRTHFLDIPIDIPAAFVGRATLVRRAEMVPVECVARGYLVGSAWDAYRNTGAVQGVMLPAGLSFGDRLPVPIFTPTTKEATGHDRPLTIQELRDLHGVEIARRLEESTTGIYVTLSDWFQAHGLTLVDTKFEFGWVDSELVLADEIATPDSSRIVRGEPGADPEWLDKQLLRDWLIEKGFRGAGEVPSIGDDLISTIQNAYREVYESLSGVLFSQWPGESCEYGEVAT